MAAEVVDISAYISFLKDFIDVYLNLFTDEWIQFIGVDRRYYYNVCQSTDDICWKIQIFYTIN